MIASSRSRFAGLHIDADVVSPHCRTSTDLRPIGNHLSDREPQQTPGHQHQNDSANSLIGGGSLFQDRQQAAHQSSRRNRMACWCEMAIVRKIEWKLDL